MEIKTFHKQNIIQKQINCFMNLFRKDKHIIMGLKERDIFIYNPSLNKIKVVVAVLIIMFCLITPFTNLLIPFIMKWGLK